METVNGSCEPCTQVSEVVSRLRNYEDYNLAMRLQEEEFNRHYEMNRGQRRQIRNDHNHCQNEQQMEDQLAAQFRQHLNFQMTQDDEAVARRLQEEFEREEQLRKESQTRHDEELARRLQEDSGQQNILQREAQARADEHLARRLQMNECNYSRQDANRGNSDTSHQNHVATIQQHHFADTTIEDDEKLARELQKKFDDEERTVRRIHRNANKKSLFKSLLPISGNWSQSQHHSRNSSHERSIVKRWQDSVDANTENEVNLQMAVASKTPPYYDESPLYSVPMRTQNGGFSGQQTAGHRPLAVIANREERNEPNAGAHIQNQDLIHMGIRPYGNNPFNDTNSVLSARSLPNTVLPGKPKPKQNNGSAGTVTTRNLRVDLGDGNETRHITEFGQASRTVDSEPDLITFDDIPSVVASHPPSNGFHVEASSCGRAPTATSSGLNSTGSAL